MQEAEELSDRLAAIDEGKMIVEGARADVRDGLGDNRAVEVEVQGPAPAAVAALEDHSLVSSVLATDERASTTTIRVQTVKPLASVALTGSVITEAGDAETV